ncbi:MAG: hypothetical protein U0795_11780 [Pirellulales bacterium]
MTGQRTLQFRFRTLLIATFVVAVPCAWIGRDFWRARRERPVIAMIRAQGGQIAYQHESTSLFSGFRYPVQLDDWPGFKLERFLFGDDLRATVAFVYLPITDPSDPALQSLPSLSHLRVVHLTGPGVTDESMDEIVRNRGIQTLHLHNTLVTPDGLSRLASLPKLESISLEGESITDDGLTPLSRFPVLHRLDIVSTQITIKGLLSLVNHPTIRHISVNSSDKLSREDIDQFQQQWPSCQVDYWQTEPDGSGWPVGLYPDRP